MVRPGRHDTFLKMALLMSERATCRRRRVGCVLTNDRGHVLATGYNGVPAGFAHCLDFPCPGSECPSGTGLDLCEAIHAEQNALLQCGDVWQIAICYCTTAPCVYCVKLLLNTSCMEIQFLSDYPHSEQARSLWTRANGGRRLWTQVSP